MPSPPDTLRQARICLLLPARSSHRGLSWSGSKVPGYVELYVSFGSSSEIPQIPTALLSFNFKAWLTSAMIIIRMMMIRIIMVRIVTIMINVITIIITGEIVVK